MSIKIGFDISQTGFNKAGCGFFADSLILALKNADTDNEYILYPHFGLSYWDPDAPENTRQISKAGFSTKIIESTRRDLIEFWDQMPADAEHRLGNPDIVHANNYSCPRNLTNIKVIYTLYDLNFVEHPEFSTEENRWLCFNGVFDAANYADFILSISNYSLNRFLEIFPHYPSERIKVVYPASRFDLNQKENGVNGIFDTLTPAKFWLAVGTLEPRKNLRRLLKAYSVYIKKVDNVLPLVFAGGAGWLEENLERYVAELDLSKKVNFLGYVSDPQLSWLYENCWAFIYPSLYEGFGLPVLEAMSLGAASVVSNVTSLPEVAGDAAHYVDPLKENEIVDAICLLAEDAEYRQKLKDMAIKQAQRFSWKKCASEVIEIYNHVITLPKR